MAACKTFKKLARQCGRGVKAGFSPDIYAIAYDDLTTIVGSTEVYTTNVTGLIDAIGILAPANKFVKIAAVLKGNSLKETFTANDNGTYDIVKEIVFGIPNTASVEAKATAEQFMGQPSAFILKFNSGQFVALGLNGQLQLVTAEGTVDDSSNGRVLTLRGSDSELLQPVDPTIIASLLSTV